MNVILSNSCRIISNLQLHVNIIAQNNDVTKKTLYDVMKKLI